MGTTPREKMSMLASFFDLSVFDSAGVLASGGMYTEAPGPVVMVAAALIRGTPKSAIIPLDLTARRLLLISVVRPTLERCGKVIRLRQQR